MVGVVWQLWQPGTNITFIMCDKSNIPFISTAMWPRQQSFGIFLFFCFIATLCKSWTFFFLLLSCLLFKRIFKYATQSNEIGAAQCMYLQCSTNLNFFFFLHWLVIEKGWRAAAELLRKGARGKNNDCRLQAKEEKRWGSFEFSHIPTWKIREICGYFTTGRVF